MVFITNKEKTTFREIALAHLKRIIEISTTEFRVGYNKLVVSGSYTFKEYVPSTIKCYIQAVESFRDILIPHFDDKMTKIHEKLLEKIKGLRKNLISEKQKRIQDDYDFKVKMHERNSMNKEPNELEFERMYNESVHLGDVEEQRLSRKKLEIMSEMFRELNLLLRRVDYLKSSVYSEEDLDEEDVEEEEDKK